MFNNLNTNNMKKLLITLFTFVILPILEKHVKDTETTIDDNVLDWIKGLFGMNQKIKLMQTLYEENIRPELEKYAKSTETEIDDKILHALDHMFRYKHEEEEE